MAGFKNSFLHPDYYYNHLEPHRRRPTLVEFPHFITHTATFVDKAKEEPRDGFRHPQSTFRNWLANFEEAKWKSELTPAFRKTLDDFARILQPLDDGPHDKEDRDVPFFIELSFRVPANQADGTSLEKSPYEKVVARIEAHLEYFTLTLFKPLGDPINIAKVYDDSLFVPMGKSEPDPGNPFHRLYADLVDRFPNSTFANFKGVVVGPDAFGKSKPAFPRLFADSDSRREAAAKTAIFLRDQKDAFKKGLFKADDDDVVACYFQRGQVIYVSALGAQYDRTSKDELRYLLIYNKEGLTEGAEYNARADRYRLSRLVNRVNAIGTVRLAALKDLRELRKAGNSLRRVETDIYMAASDQTPRSVSERKISGKKRVRGRYRQFTSMIFDLDKTARDFNAETGTPLLFRAARSRLYFDQMKNLLEELGSETIPQWQSYNQFLSRRLFAQLGFTARLGDRMSELWALSRSRAEATEAETLRWLKLAAQWASLLLVPAAIADMLKERTSLRTIVGRVYEAVTDRLPIIDSWVRDRWHTVPAEIRRWWREVPEESAKRQEFWLVYALTFCVWAVIILWLWHHSRPRNTEGH